MTLQGQKASEIKEKRSELEALKETTKTRKSEIKDLETRKQELLTSVREAEEAKEVEESKTELEETETSLESKREELETLKDEVKGLEDEITDLEKELDDLQDVSVKKGEERNMKNEELQIRTEATAAFIKSRGREERDGLVSGDVGVVIPEEIAYNPELEVKTVQDLSKLVTKIKVSTASGKHPILKRPTTTLNTVAELEANPELAKPEFKEVAWAVETYRGAIPISNEALDDAAVDLMNLVAAHAQQIKVNTLNAAITGQLKGFAPKTAKGIDEIKDIINVELDPAYNVKIVASQSFYNELDKLKDGEGRYLLKDDITSASGKQLLGHEVIVVSDKVLGAAGEAKAFIGDLGRAILFADRKDLEVSWADHNIYGKYLQAVVRFDVEKADTEAGFFVTFEAAAEKGE